MSAKTTSTPDDRRSPQSAPTKLELEDIQTRFGILAKRFKKSSGIPTSKGKIRAIFAKLAKKGYRLGQQTMVHIDSYSTYPNQRTHGIVRGTRRAAPYDAIQIASVTEEMYNKLKTANAVYGTIVNCKIDKKTNKFSLVCILDGMFALVGEQQLPPAPTRDKPVLTLVKDQATEVAEAGAKKEDRSVQGPNGSEISIGEFFAYTSQHGCGECGGFVNPDHASKVRWIGDTAICHECCADMDVVRKHWPPKSMEQDAMDAIKEHMLH